MEFQSVQYSVNRLIQWIRSGRLALPDFQRDFVWNPSRVTELLDSVARQWPIGSLLLLSGPQPFGFREISDAPTLKGEKLDYYVLDGQQRITSLYHAISDVSEYVYFVDFAKLADDSEDYIGWEKRPVFSKKFAGPKERAHSSIALVKDIWELDAFYEWVGAISDPLVQRRYVSLREKRLGGLQANVYKLMAIELEQSIQLEALARIFETLNRTGVKLNAFDLMVAMLYPTGFHLRDKWNEACVDFSQLTDFEVDPIEILKLAALLIRTELGKKSSKGIRQGDLLDLDARLITDYWARAVNLYAATLDVAKNNFGIYCADAVPSTAMLLGLAGFVDRRDHRVHTWFWGSAFSQAYGQAANTVVVADFDALASDSIESVAVQRMRDPFAALDEPARRNGLALRAMACFIAMQEGSDPISGAALSDGGSLKVRALDDSGDLRKLTGEDGFDRLVFLSNVSDQKLAKAKSSNWRELVSEGELYQRLRTQLIGSNKRRDLNDFRSRVFDVAQSNVQRDQVAAVSRGGHD